MLGLRMIYGTTGSGSAGARDGGCGFSPLFARNRGGPDLALWGAACGQKPADFE